MKKRPDEFDKWNKGINSFVKNNGDALMECMENFEKPDKDIKSVTRGDKKYE
jgi:hypothetical protein